MNIEELYGIYTTLSDAGESISQHGKEYAKAIEATKLGAPEKQLATQIITKFFASFPALQNNALNAIFDLCEEEDKTICMAAMKALPNFCKDALFIDKITDIMSQMLQLDKPVEQTCATNVLFEILKKDPAIVVKRIFKTIHSLETDITSLVRFRCIQFILTKIKILDSNLVTAEVQELMISNVKTTLNVCIADEFVLLMNYLVTTKLVLTLPGQKEIFDLVMGQIEIDKDFRPYRPQCNFTNRLVCCVKFILPFFSVNVQSTRLIKYYCDKVLREWDDIGELNNGLQYQIAVAQQLATMAPFCGQLDSPTKQVEAIFDVLKLYMPAPPEDTASNEMPELNFNIVEALLCAFHALARQCPEFLTEDQPRLKDFRSRLLYFSRGVQGCLKVLNLNTTEKVFNADEKRIREMSPLLLKNINMLAKDLFYTPPVYKHKIILSCLKKEEAAKPVARKKPPPATVEAVAPPPAKRHVPITYESNGEAPQNKQKRVGGDKNIYHPPSGKFSQNIHHRGRGGGFRGSGRGRGGYKGGYRN